MNLKPLFSALDLDDCLAHDSGSFLSASSLIVRFERASFKSLSLDLVGSNLVAFLFDLRTNLAFFISFSWSVVTILAVSF